MALTAALQRAGQRAATPKPCREAATAYRGILAQGRAILCGAANIFAARTGALDRAIAL